MPRDASPCRLEPLGTVPMLPLWKGPSAKSLRSARRPWLCPAESTHSAAVGTFKKALVQEIKKKGDGVVDSVSCASLGLAAFPFFLAISSVCLLNIFHRIAICLRPRGGSWRWLWPPLTRLLEARSGLTTRGFAHRLCARRRLRPGSSGCCSGEHVARLLRPNKRFWYFVYCCWCCCYCLCASQD